MRSYNDLYGHLTSYENLELAFKKAKKGKTLKDYVVRFESNIEENLLKLQFELQSFTYRPMPIQTFIIRDPKTRRIGASDFRDRVVHHAICNVISPILGNSFIFDSFANQKGKGTHSAIKRFEKFMRGAPADNCRIQIGGGASEFWTTEPMPVMCSRQI